MDLGGLANYTLAEIASCLNARHQEVLLASISVAANVIQQLQNEEQMQQAEQQEPTNLQLTPNEANNQNTQQQQQQQQQSHQKHNLSSSQLKSLVRQHTSTKNSQLDNSNNKNNNTTNNNANTNNLKAHQQQTQQQPASQINFQDFAQKFGLSQHDSKELQRLTQVAQKQQQLHQQIDSQPDQHDDLDDSYHDSQQHHSSHIDSNSDSMDSTSFEERNSTADPQTLRTITLFADELKHRRKSIRLSQKGAAQSLRAFTGGEHPCTDAIIYHFENLQLEPERALELIPLLTDWLVWAEKHRHEGKQLPMMVAVTKVPRERKRKVVLFNEKAKEFLESAFLRNNHPDRFALDLISAELNIPTRSIRKWFTNRRQRKRFAEKFDANY